MTSIQAVTPEMVLVPAGPFLMGSDRKRFPQSGFHGEPEPVTLALPQFWIGKYQVTVKEYRAFVDAGGYQLGENIWGYYGRVWRDKITNQIKEPSEWNEPFWTGDERLPVNNVCWYEAMAYCRWISAKFGSRYSLPTEAEWEKAARGIDGRIYPWGDTFEAARCNSGRPQYQRWDGIQHQACEFTAPVGSYPEGASPYGAMDMSGNVWEWCLSMTVDLDRYPDHVDPRRYPKDQNPDHPTGRILRGGCYCSRPDEVRTAARSWGDPELRLYGFRVALSGLRLG
jgi:formylglycine-generating enzyme required for sulfatase activity